MATLLLSQTVSDKYKEVSEVLNSIEVTNPIMKKKSMKELMQQSFFHGASWMGSNFIA